MECEEDAVVPACCSGDVLNGIFVEGDVFAPCVDGFVETVCDGVFAEWVKKLAQVFVFEKSHAPMNSGSVGFVGVENEYCRGFDEFRYGYVGC